LIPCNPSQDIYSRKFRYSYDWARSIVAKLYNKYPRATDLLCEGLEITHDNLAYYLAHNDAMWPTLRTCVHIIERRRRNRAIECGEIKSFIYTVVKWLAVEKDSTTANRLRKRLISLDKTLDLE
jgi:hypothetical protein